MFIIKIIHHRYRQRYRYYYIVSWTKLIIQYLEIVGNITTTTTTTATTTEVTKTTPQVTCLAGYELFAAVGNGWCVKFETSIRLNHVDAKTHCLGEGQSSQLAVINTLEKFDVIKNKIRTDYAGGIIFVVNIN